MIRRANPTLHYADIGPIGAAILPKPVLQQANSGKTGNQSAKSGREIDISALLVITQSIALHIDHRSGNPQSP